MTSLLTVQQLADQWQTSAPTIYRLVREFGLPVVRFHPKADMRFDPEDAAAWLESRKGIKGISQ